MLKNIENEVRYVVDKDNTVTDVVMPIDFFLKLVDYFKKFNENIEIQDEENDSKEG